MKKILATIILSLIVLSNAFTQIRIKDKSGKVPYDEYMVYKKNDIYIQYGTPNILEVSPAIANREIVNDKYTFKLDGYWFSGVAGAGYNYYKSPYFYIGGYLGINASGMDLIDKKTNDLVYKSTLTSYTALVNFHWIYYKKGICQLSSGVYLGASYLDETITDYNKSYDKNFMPGTPNNWRVAYHLTALKARFGGNIGGFIELGFGYKGIVNAGLSIKI